MCGDRGRQRVPARWGSGGAVRRLTHIMTTPPCNEYLKETGNHERLLYVHLKSSPE